MCRSSLGAVYPVLVRYGLWTTYTNTHFVLLLFIFCELNVLQCEVSVCVLVVHLRVSPGGSREKKEYNPLLKIAP